EGTTPAAADLPAADTLRLEPERSLDGRRDLLAVLPADSVHAAGAPLLGDQDRCRLHRAHVDDHRVLRGGAGACDPPGRQARIARRARLVDRRAASLRAPAGARQLL